LNSIYQVFQALAKEIVFIPLAQALILIIALVPIVLDLVVKTDALFPIYVLRFLLEVNAQKMPMALVRTLIILVVLKIVIGLNLHV
jgi:hypothetical protein